MPLSCQICEVTCNCGAGKFKSEAKHFGTRDFTPGQVSWNLEAASSSRSSVSATADHLRQDWDNCLSGEEVLKVLRGIPETEAEALVNRVLLAQYRALPAAICRELEQDAMVIFDFHGDPYWGDPGKVAVLHGQKVHDSNFHFVYLTTNLVSAHYRFTIYITSHVAGFPIASYLPGALAQVWNVTEPRLLLFDGEFPTVELLSYLDQSLLPWDARKSFTRSFLLHPRGLRGRGSRYKQLLGPWRGEKSKSPSTLERHQGLQYR